MQLTLGLSLVAFAAIIAAQQTEWQQCKEYFTPAYSLAL